MKKAGSPALFSPSLPLESREGRLFLELLLLLEKGEGDGEREWLRFFPDFLVASLGGCGLLLPAESV